LVLDAPPVFTPDEMAAIFTNFFVSFPADPLGAHLTSIWMRFRDQFTWFPWHARHVDRLNPVDRPTPADIQHWVMMYNAARKTYMPAYRAACFHGEGACRAAAALTVPAVFLASEEDMLFGHLDRLPPLRPNQRIQRLAHDPPAKLAAIVRLLRAMPAGPAWPGAPKSFPVGRDPAVLFVDTPDGQVFTRTYGDPGRPAVVLLHDAPGTGLALDGLARRLAAGAHVILPDLPGTGESEAPGAECDILEVAARAVGAIADALAIRRFAVAAIGCGCAVASHPAVLDDPRLAAILVESPPVPDATAAAAIAPEIPLSAEGAHWLQAWLMIRDGQIYRPWFDGRVAAQRRRQGNFDADWLHDQTFALMKSRTTYHRLPQAAFQVDPARALTAASVPVRHAAEDGLADLVRAWVDRVE
jgi:pimeloyl-ACP methyl ester carboxylesterase